MKRLYICLLFQCCLAAQTVGLEGLNRPTAGREGARAGSPAALERARIVSCEKYAELQPCHDALPASDGIMLLPANSVWTLTGTLNITKNRVMLMGGGMGSSVIRRSPALRSGDLICARGAGFRISGVTLDGNRVSHLAEELALFGDDALVDGIEVRNNAHIAIAVAGIGARIVGSSLLGLGSAETGFMGIWFDSSRTSDLVISDNVIKDQRLNGIFGSGKNIEVARNYLSGNHRQVYPTGGGQIAIKGVDTNANIAIVGNTVEQGGGAVTSGLEIDGPGVDIVWNHIRGQGLFGIILQSGFGHQVVGNTVTNSGTILIHQPGIYVAAGVTRFRVLGNRVYDDQSSKTQSWGLRVETGPSADYAIAGNDFRGNIYAPGMIDGGYGMNRQVYGNF